MGIKNGLQHSTMSIPSTVHLPTDWPAHLFYAELLIYMNTHIEFRSYDRDRRMLYIFSWPNNSDNSSSKDNMWQPHYNSKYNYDLFGEDINDIINA